MDEILAAMDADELRASKSTALFEPAADAADAAGAATAATTAATTATTTAAGAPSGADDAADERCSDSVRGSESISDPA